MSVRDFDKDWCITAAEAEGDHEVGAGALIEVQGVLVTWDIGTPDNPRCQTLSSPLRADVIIALRRMADVLQDLDDHTFVKGPK